MSSRTRGRGAGAPLGVQILGTRGIPNRHGGFEAFAEDLSRHLVGLGWDVTVYCQEDASDACREPWESTWEGVRRVHVPVRQRGAAGTIVFDWRCTRLAVRDVDAGIPLVLGYNTALFSAAYRLRGRASLLNMDGLEWKRAKYGPLPRAWFYVNEWLGCWVADHLIADHPEIARHLAGRVRAERISTIPYGARVAAHASAAPLAALDLVPLGYALVVARPERENSILEIVRAYGRRARGMPLVVLGRYTRAVPYERAVLEAAGPEVRFVGPIYDRTVVDALRAHTCLYVHGHTVGGTNPSLVEALGAGSPVLAHANPYNRWVCGDDAARFFADEEACGAAFDALLVPHAAHVRAMMRVSALRRHTERFTLQRTLGQYEGLLRQWALGARAPARLPGDARVASGSAHS